MKLFRPVGLKELQLLQQLDFKGFPPRLPVQPIFYPVTTIEYARQIARDWNTKDPTSDYIGWVLGFELPDDWASRYPVRQAGSRDHQELWVPAEGLADLNTRIVGTIQVLEVYRGDRFTRVLDPNTLLPVNRPLDPPYQEEPC